VRALTAEETALLEYLLHKDTSHVDVLRAQIPLTSVLGTWVAGSASLNLSVAAEAVPAPLPDGPIPGEVWAYAPDGSTLGTVLLWVVDGVLSAVEYGWVTDVPPAELPPVSSLHDILDDDRKRL
jgi:hypothetical protein